MRTRQLLPLFALAALLGGCSGTASAPNGKPSPQPGKPGAPAEPADAGAFVVPDALKHDAYAYYGFEKTGEMTYVFQLASGAEAKQGAQTTSPQSLKGEEATYKITRTGSLVDLGDDVMAVRPDGIYLVSGTSATPKTPTLVIPAELPVGAVWDNNYTLTTANGQPVTIKGKSKVEKLEKLKVKAGTFDCLVVSQTAKMNNNGVTGDVAGKTWFAKGVGIIKMRLEVKDAQGQIITSAVELAKIGDSK